MMHFLHRYLYEDIWIPVWPNWFAGAVGFAVGYFWKGRAWLHKHADHQKKIAEIHTILTKKEKK